MCANKFQKIQPLEQDQNTLVEYEEVVLASGLPMNEIWLRIEKLRQNFYFLPCPEDRSCPDPQRIVFNEDIVHFVYPLSQRTFSFDLVVRVLHMLKIPLPIQRHDNVSHFDAIEEVLSVLLFKVNTLFRKKNHQRSYLLIHFHIQPFLDCPAFDVSLVELIREFSSGPSFVRTHIGHEIYTNVLTEFLFLFAEALPQHRIVFLRIWMRFERILIAQERLLTNDVPADRCKKLRSQIKSLLKREENRNEIVLYTEYAMIENELGDSSKADAIFQASIAQSEATSQESASACVAYVELLMQRRHFNKAMDVLVALALNDDSTRTASEPIPEYRKLQARKSLAEKCKAHLDAIRETTVELELDQVFCDSPVVTYIKAKVYFLVMTKSKNEAIQEIEVALRSVPEPTPMHRFVRERLYELYANVLQVIDGRGHSANLLLFNVLRRGLDEFPDNLVLVRFAVTLEGQVNINIIYCLYL